MLAAGVVILAMAGYCVYLIHYVGRRRHEMITTETVTTQELHTLQEAARGAAGTGFFEEKCEVIGTAQLGPSGTVQAELSGKECAWHRHVIIRKYWEKERRPSGGSRRVEREETVAERESEEDFVVRDETGEITVRPTAGTVKHMQKVVNRFEPHSDNNDGASLSIGKLNLRLPSRRRQGTIGYRYAEWVLTPGTKVYVLGVARDRTGELAMDETSLVSTKDEVELLTDARKKERILLLGAGFGTVVGVTLIVVSLPL